ncbi:MAG: S41 family peptidase [Planctomycetota bacterium]
MKNRELVFVVVTVLVLSCITLAGPHDRHPKSEMYDRYETFARIISTIQEHYVKEVETEELFRDAYSGMLQGLDPHSAFLPPEAAEDLNVETKGEFGGLGIEITINKQGWLTVITPLEGTPAFEAGVLAGDIITKIEGKSTEGLGLREAVHKLRGPKDKPVTITVLHETGKEEEITIVRDIIELQSVKAARFADEDAKIGYIRLSAFQANTVKNLAEAVEKLQKEGMRGLVIDLRFNPGGLLTAAVEVADRFIEDGVIVATKGRTQKERLFEAKREGTYPDFPLAVLISRRSASAAEIFAGAVQDHKRGLVVGMRTYGKGSVQTLFPLQGRKSAIRLTTAYYYTPSGRLIHRNPNNPDQETWGIEPDQKIEVPLEEEIELWNHWREEHIQEARERNGEPPRPETPDEPEKPEAPRSDEKPEAKKEFRDRTLDAAVTALKTILWTRERAPAAAAAAD